MIHLPLAVELIVTVHIRSAIGSGFIMILNLTALWPQDYATKIIKLIITIGYTCMMYC